MMQRLCLALVALTLTCCGVSRQVVKSNTQTSVETVDTLHAATTAERSGQSATHTELERDEEVATVVLEFDTTLPVDPATGTPPVKRKTTQTRRAATTAWQEVVSEERGKTRIDIDGRTMTKEKTSVVKEEHTRKGLNWAQRALCWVGAFSIIGLVIWAVSRRYKRW